METVQLHSPQGDYYGNLKNGMRSGWGIMKWHQGKYKGVLFQGEFRLGKVQGKGYMKNLNGIDYIGQFKNKKVNGQAKEINSNGDIYEGHYLKNFK